MEGGEDDDELKLAKASAGLLADLERDLPKVFRKPAKSGRHHVHSHVRKRDLDHMASLIEPFQGEPQLLDAKLKFLLPTIVDAYLESGRVRRPARTSDHVGLETAVTSLLYTLCKVRGYKVIVGFLNNEPRYLEPILEALERTFSPDAEPAGPEWRVAYVLLLWLSHLLLTPFDLKSISTNPGPGPWGDLGSIRASDLPPLMRRILRAGLWYLSSPTKAQDAAATMLVRLAKRPDVQELRLADSLVHDRLPRLQESTAETQNIYEMLGSLRLIAGISSSAELVHLTPAIYHTCETVFDQPDRAAALSSNAVEKKIVVKIFRNVAILSLRSLSTDGLVQTFLQTTSVLENVIDYLLRSLADKDTPVRYAAAKALSLIVLELDEDVGYDVIQAILDSFKEDMPRSGWSVDFATANPLKWHGLTLALSHCLFKRSASPEQLPDILDALISALQFQQRTTTGTTLGTNVRDAANFGVWSLARRYTTAELLRVPIPVLGARSDDSGPQRSVVQFLAVQLVLSACLDPAGNIRRGSSAALQELVGRHPDQVDHGISLVQIVEYQAISLRSRAMVDVANAASALHPLYWEALLHGLLGWRGLGSADVPSRESAAKSLAGLAGLQPATESADVLDRVMAALQECPGHDVESLHGLTLTAADILAHRNESATESSRLHGQTLARVVKVYKLVHNALKEFSPRMLRSEFPASLIRFTTVLCDACHAAIKSDPPIATDHVPRSEIEAVTQLVLWRHEEWILRPIPDLARSLLKLSQAAGSSSTCIGAQTLSDRVTADGSKSTFHGAGRAIALGALASRYDSTGLSSEEAAAAVTSLSGLMRAPNVDWRIIGAKALQLVADDFDAERIRSDTAERILLATHAGLTDYTVDERGDVGSLVRLQSIMCASKLFAAHASARFEPATNTLAADIFRLSLERLDRVRLAAARCRRHYLGLERELSDIGSVSSVPYFQSALEPLARTAVAWSDTALLEGCISCASVGTESLLQAARHVLASILAEAAPARLEGLMATYAAIMKEFLTGASSGAGAGAGRDLGLELLAFLLDAQLPQRLARSPTFPWRTLLSTVQKSHHQSNDLPKLLAAVHVYRGLADVPALRPLVLAKLLAMLRTNPFPRVRVAVAETLWLVAPDQSLAAPDWAAPPSRHAAVLDGLRARHAAAS